LISWLDIQSRGLLISDDRASTATVAFPTLIANLALELAPIRVK